MGLVREGECKRVLLHQIHVLGLTGELESLKKGSNTWKNKKGEELFEKKINPLCGLAGRELGIGILEAIKDPEETGWVIEDDRQVYFSFLCRDQMGNKYKLRATYIEGGGIKENEQVEFAICLEKQL